jgi:hypothetical protein
MITPTRNNGPSVHFNVRRSTPGFETVSADIAGIGFSKHVCQPGFVTVVVSVWGRGQNHKKER